MTLVASLFALSTAAMAVMSFDTGVPVIVPLAAFGLGYSCIPGSIWAQFANSCEVRPMALGTTTHGPVAGNP